ncbi:MAG TPA: NADH-quinone oxidoreductase subunit C [Thermoanaerobaculia bacterium]|nr:NADH-quinone oxidoreductase subunit C [Thermoanaerobaculia bacterium]
MTEIEIGTVVRRDERQALREIECRAADLPAVCERLFRKLELTFGGLIVDETSSAWELRYVFYGHGGTGWVHVIVRQPLDQKVFPSITAALHASDWHEREAEDLFGLSFDGHPRLGDFILHDDRWQEGLAPMRRSFDGSQPVMHRQPEANWRPRRVVRAPGAFVMPVGPKFSGATEPVHFLLETVGEDVIRTYPRLFYKYRAVEKIAEGQAAASALLLAERFAATTAFAHALAFSQAIETVGEIAVPPRARTLRILLSELERLRHHAGAVQEICESTALVVANSQAAILEEDLLRLCGALTGHRYLFGLAVPGGLSRDFADDVCRDAAAEVRAIAGRCNRLEEALDRSSSFLDRLEEVGFVSHSEAREFGLVGPVARASGVARDLRKMQPYAGFEEYAFKVPVEEEGDGYARLRVLFAEIRESAAIIEQAVTRLTAGPVIVEPAPLPSGSAMGWVEAPRGAALHWVRLDDRGRVARYRVVTPSFMNWHGFHLAAENFAFQDFPIILATFDLSVAENDR